MSCPLCCMCSVTSEYVIDTSLTVQLGLGQSAAFCSCCWLGGLRVAEPVICPLRTGRLVVGPVSGPNIAVFGGGLLPPGLTHCNSAVTSLAVRKAPVGRLASPAALNLTVSAPLELLVYDGVPMKCGDAAEASIGAISNKADAIAAVVVVVIPIFLGIGCSLITIKADRF